MVSIIYVYIVLMPFIGSWTIVESNQCNDPKFGLASYYASNMVLQRAPARPRIWGFTPYIGDQITVELNKGEQRAAVDLFTDADGLVIWEALFDPITAAGPHVITVKSRSCLITLVNILVGDVWICAGQSNMEMTLSQINDPKQDIDNALNFKNIRLFYNKHKSSNVPLRDLKGIIKNWASPSSGNIPHFSAVCWFFGRNLFKKYGRPIGLIQGSVDATRIEAWSSSEALLKCSLKIRQSKFGTIYNNPSVLYNAMINPFIPMPIYGMIWYQGESNCDFFDGNQERYGCMIKAMVADLRFKWHARSPEMKKLFPFGEVQLAPWRNEDISNGYSDIRWAQTDSYGYVPNENMKNFFMAVAIDLPDFDPPGGNAIHPRYKRQIADRLSLAAYNVAYGSTDTGLYQGPLPTSISFDKPIVRITYNTPLVHRTTKAHNFELCCGMLQESGGRWVGTFPAYKRNRSVGLRNVCKNNESVTGFRYLWRESPCDLESCPIYSIENNLPAPPYIYIGAIKPGLEHIVHIRISDTVLKNQILNYFNFFFIVAVVLTAFLLCRVLKGRTTKLCHIMGFYLCVCLLCLFLSNRTYLSFPQPQS